MNSFIPLSTPFLKYDIPHRANEEPEIANEEHESLDLVLDSMFPHKKWTDEDGVEWISRVSKIPTTRIDALALQNLLNDSIEHYQASETGLCPIRRELYDKCFDELVRQVTINCSDEGMLLFRIGNEFRMTMAAFKVVYESSVAFGLRQAVKNESNISEMQGQKDDIANEKARLETKLTQLQISHELTKVKHDETLKSVVGQYEEKVAGLKKVIAKQKKLIEVLNRKPIEL